MRLLRVLDGDLDIMVDTSWKIKQLLKDIESEDAMENGGLDLVIASGAAFTREGWRWRCGHGGGHYDRFLAGIARHAADPRALWRPHILAVGFAQQMYAEIPVDKQDVKVDEVVTAE